jgi:thiamine kinase-like enzyme
MIYHTEYTDPHYKSIQNLYEKIRNQIEEGDILYIHDETDYIIAMYKTFQKRLTNKEIIPVCKNLFLCLFKDKITQLIKYEKTFIKLYVVLSDAITDLLSILKLNKRYNTSKMKLEKQYPIPITYDFKDASTEVTYLRKINKHDYSLSMIEYIVTNEDGTIKYKDADSLEAEFLFPSIENVYKNKGDNFFTKKVPFYDNSGILLFKKYIILKPYSKGENILDSLSKNQVLPKYFHLVNSLFEIPRDSENGIYEMKVESPQMPIILPKYAMADGKFFICVNVGAIPITIKIPGFKEDVHDLIGPEEVCMYIYTGVAASTTSFYGRVQWISNRIAYDMLYNVPRTSLCCKLTDLSKYVFMRTEKLPLFDLSGYMVEAMLDENSCVYNIDDFYKACAYKVTIGPEMKISDLEVNSEWGEQGVPGIFPTSIPVVEEDSSNLAVFCNPNGIPAIDEFGFTRYVKSPLLQINDKIVTRSSTGENIEVTLNADMKIIQYGLMPKDDIFSSTFRSNFVKPFVPPGTTGSIPMDTFVFVNSIGYPLVSTSNEYIQVENFVFEPPIYVKYTENLVTEYSYIPEDGKFFVPSKTILNIKPFPKLALKTAEEWEVTETSADIKILSYRYATGDAYIQFVITQLRTDVGTCETLRKDFSGISETVDMLNEYIRDVSSLYDDYKSYSTSIIALKTRNLILDTSNDEKMVMNTFDLKMKNVLNKVYKMYTDGKKPVAFFKNIVKKINKIRKEVKELQDVKGIEIVKSITNIQAIDQNYSIIKGGAKNASFTGILNTTSAKKVEFDGILKTLQTNLTNVPKDLNELEGWVNTQEILIDNANGLYKEIMDLDNISTTDVFTQQIINNTESAVKKMEENVEKLKGLIQYKKKIALWLEIYPDSDVQKEYRDKPTIPTSVVSLKGYTIQFPPFEELENPFVKRDWYTLPDTDILNISTRTRITMNIIEPIKAFIEKNKDF